ncbi:MAG: cytochrome c4 [Chromatiales bacterium]|nr:cytochrome c4 [Chromatiales bacterium]
MARAGLAALLALGLAAPAMAAGDAAAGQAKAITCAACHGVDGNSLNPEWPSLAGQHESYTIKQLQAFKSGARQNVLMSGQAMALSDQDMADLAAYFAGQKPARKTADPALVEAGEQIYRGGNKETGAPACLACHGPDGLGNITAAWPQVSGQHATYTAAQLAAYRSGQRSTDGDTQIMRNVAARLTDDEIKAVASYIQGLQ